MVIVVFLYGLVFCLDVVGIIMKCVDVFVCVECDCGIVDLYCWVGNVVGDVFDNCVDEI